MFEEPLDNEQTITRSPHSKKIKKYESQSPNKNNGHWTKDEHEKYLQFLQDHVYMKKNNKIFKPMSEIIGTRSPSQCRSHHQKFNPLSPQVQRKVFRKINKREDETNIEIEQDQKGCTNQIKLMFFDEEEQQVQDFNLDDYI